MAAPADSRSILGVIGGSSLARYTFLLFTFAALLPVLYIAYLSYERVSEQLRDQSVEQSRQLSKSLGMELFRRVDNASARLARILADARQGAALSAADLGDFERLTIRVPGTAPRPVIGPVLESPTLDAEQSESLTRNGRALALIQTGSGEIELVLLQQDGSDRDELAVATLAPEVLASLTELMPGTSQLLLTGPSGEAVMQSAAWLGTVRPRLQQALGDGSSGYFAWRAQTGEQLAAYWSLFTLPEFGLERIVVLVSADESAALAAISQFRSTYLPVLVLLVVAVALVTARQLRIRLLPLIELRDATRSISRGEFRVRMDVASDDEIGELATAFNDMSARLDHQFSNLEAMAEIDRQILSSFDTRNIVETVVNRAGEITPCDWVAMLDISADDPGAAQLTARSLDSSGELVKQAVVLPETVSSAWAREREVLLDTGSVGVPDCLGELPADQFATDGQLLLLPILIEEQLAAVLVFAFRSARMPGPDSLQQLRKFADHLTVAFANARWESRLFQQAHYDTLTGLPNRALMLDRLSQAMSRADRSGGHVALLFIDLDQFKVVNDSLGHAAGDKLLAWCAERLRGSVRTPDTVARFGGDEFIVILPDIDRSEGATLESVDVVARHILSALEETATIDDVPVDTGSSLGIAVYPEDAATAEELVACADAAMYSAKAAGRNCYRFYRAEMNEAALRRLGFKQELRRALANDELRLYYQPKYDCASERLVGAEALVRWLHPTRGMLPPGEFVELAEQMGCIEELGHWVFTRACTDIASWRDRGLPEVKIAINVSPRQFRAQDLAPIVRDILVEHRVNPSLVELEVTESAVMEHPPTSIETLGKLRDIGVTLAIDDFGTGYSSLAYLKDFLLDTLKIDQSFIAAILDDSRAESIVSTVIALAHDLDLTVVAEGVELGEQYAALRGMGCDIIQGFLFGRPMPEADFAQLLAGQAADVA